jgi:hypothetical protein
MKTTKETREVIAALGAVIARTIRVQADGTVTGIEKVSFIKDAPEVYDALVGISEVPAELADLDTGERIILSGDIRMILIEVGISHRNSDIADWILEWAYDFVRSTVLLIHRIKTAPPSAIAA